MSVIFNLYHHAKSCVRANGKMSDYFTCNGGVRQGENLSPLLFAIYLNDFESYVSRHYKGLDTLSDDITCHLSDPDIEVFLRLHVLLYFKLENLDWFTAQIERRTISEYIKTSTKG